MIVGIGGNGRFQRRCLGQTRSLLLEADGVHMGEIGIALALVLGHQIKRRLGLLDLAGTHIDASKPDQGFRVVRNVLENHAVDLRGLPQLTGGGRRFGRLEGVGNLGFERIGLGLARRGAGNDLVGKTPHFALRHGAHEAIHGATAGKGEDGREGLDAELAGNVRVLVDIDLDQLDLAGLFPDHLFDGRAELAAGAAPGRPEIDQHRHLERGIDDIGLEAGIAAVPNEIGGNRGGGRGAIKGEGHGFQLFSRR
ncbi:hypothetical protein D3C87_1397560 [compost metagenome]